MVKCSELEIPCTLLHFSAISMGVNYISGTRPLRRGYRPQLVEILLPFYGTLVPYSQQPPNEPYPKLSPTPYILQNIHFTNSFLGLI
jgi:hypothetical protein